MDNYNGLYPADGQGTPPPTGGQGDAYSPDGQGHSAGFDSAAGPNAQGGQPDGEYHYTGPQGDLYGGGLYPTGQDSWQNTQYGGQAGSKYPGWEFYNNAWYATPEQPAVQPQPSYYQAPAPDPQPRKKRGRGAAKAVALVLACVVGGFGGGAAAGYLTGGSGGNSDNAPAVVYKAPDTFTGAASGVNQADGLSVSDIAEIAGRSVVSITTENEVRDFYSGGRVVSGAGSGVIITEDGYIVTNHHVITGAQTVKVTLPNGDEHEAQVIASDQRTDVAVLKINVTGLTPAVVGDSDNLKVGEFCIAIGNPMGTLGGTVTNGIISALNREITIEGQNMNLLQMSAAVSPGNSGGGLFNDKGQLIGIVNAKSSGDDTEGLGFAIPINTAMQVAEELISGGYVSGRPGLGVTVETILDEMEAMQAGYAGAGVYIASVSPGSAAETAGLQVGDRILSVDGEEIASGSQLSALISEKAIGDAMKLVIERDGQQMSVPVVLGELRT